MYGYFLELNENLNAHFVAIDSFYDISYSAYLNSEKMRKVVKIIADKTKNNYNYMFEDRFIINSNNFSFLLLEIK